MDISAAFPNTFATVGDYLKFLRRRARLSQRDLSIAVGYSESHISRIENNERLIDRASVLALFVPALHVQHEPEIVEFLLALCSEQHSAPTPERVAHPTPPDRPLIHGNLPVALTSFIGRAEEVAEALDLLRDRRTRLLTMTGAGGCGKTRLALRVAEEVAHNYGHGVWLVELAPLADPELLPKTLAVTLELSERADRSQLAILTDSLRPRQALLILDNCEHLVDAVARLAVALLQACPRLQIIATSCQALAVPGEVNLRIQPLALPPAQRGAQPKADAIAHYDAIRLFAERGHESLHTFTLTDKNAPAVARICQRLDGIPLGIELAAAWINLLSSEQIALRLEQGFDLLVSAGRAVLPRHQTLRAAIEWSYTLLAPAERMLLRRLSVFVGGWSLEAAEAAATADAGQQIALAGPETIKLMHQLVNKSLVIAERSPGGQARYRLLAPLAEYLYEELVKAGEEICLADCHLAHFLALAEHADGALRARSPAAWLTCLESEQENLRAALRWSLAQHRMQEGLRLAVALGRFWHHRGHYDEGRRWLQALLAQSAAASEPRAQALLWLAILTRLQGELEEARALSQESLLLFAQSGDQRGRAAALENIGWTYSNTDRTRAITYFQESQAIFHSLGCLRQSGRLLTTQAQMWREMGDFERAKEQLHEALVLCRATEDRQGLAQTLNGLSELASLAGDYDQAARLLDESLTLALVAGSEQDLAWVHCALAENCWHRADYQAALQHGDISQHLFQQLGSATGQAIALHHLALARLALGDVEQAAAELRTSWELCGSVGHAFMQARCQAGLAATVLRQGKAAHAAQMLAAANICFAAHPEQLAPADRDFYARLKQECHSQLDEQDFSAVWVSGEAISCERSLIYTPAPASPFTLVA